MNTITLPISTLRAAITHAASKDVRYYLVGVCLDLSAGKVYATDGHRAFICVGPHVEDGGQVILPRDFVQTIIKAHKARTAPALCTIQIDGPALTATVPGGTATAKAIDGSYPNMQRIIPRGEPTTDHVTVNPTYMLEAWEALALFRGRASITAKRSKGHICTWYATGGDAPIVVHDGSSGAFCIIMPLRGAPELTNGVREMMNILPQAT